MLSKTVMSSIFLKNVAGGQNLASGENVFGDIFGVFAGVKKTIRA